MTSGCYAPTRFEGMMILKRLRDNGIEETKEVVDRVYDMLGEYESDVIYEKVSKEFGGK